MGNQYYEAVGTDIMGPVARLVRVNTVNTSDTIPFNDFDTVLSFQAILASDMKTIVAGSISGNVVTITTTNLTNVTIIALVSGSVQR
jgi:hypothetical protein